MSPTRGDGQCCKSFSEIDIASFTFSPAFDRGNSETIIRLLMVYHVNPRRKSTFKPKTEVNTFQNQWSPLESTHFFQDFPWVDYVDLVIVAFSFVGTLMLLAFITARRRQTKLPPTTAMSLRVLLSADLLFLFISFVFSISHVAGGEKIEEISVVKCMIFNILYWLSLTLQGHVQCVVSIERVIAIGHPLKVKTIVTKRRMMVVLLSVILLVSVCQSLYILLTTDFSTSICRRQNSDIVRIVDYVDYVIVRCGLPLSVLFACSLYILICLWKSRRSVGGGSRRRIAKELKLGVALVIIDAIFIISAVPHFFVMMMIPPDPDDDQFILITKITNRLRGLGAITDWLVLLFLGRQMRAGLLKTVCNNFLVMSLRKCCTHCRHRKHSKENTPACTSQSRVDVSCSWRVSGRTLCWQSTRSTPVSM